MWDKPTFSTPTDNVWRACIYPAVWGCNTRQLHRQTAHKDEGWACRVHTIAVLPFSSCICQASACRSPRRLMCISIKPAEYTVCRLNSQISPIIPQTCAIGRLDLNIHYPCRGILLFSTTVFFRLQLKTHGGERKEINIPYDRTIQLCSRKGAFLHEKFRR